MGIFKCAKCGCAENTALGLYWTRKNPEIYDWSDVGEEYKNKPLCSECAPSKLYNGNPSGWGKWHGKFEKKPYDG
jgi:hypothetical protein